MALVELKDIKKSFLLGGEEVEILHGVNLSVEEGEFVAMMGPSGSGKSTTMNILGCLDKPTSGQYFLDGRDVSELNRDELAAIRNSTIGFVFQGFNLIDELNVAENIELPLLYMGVSSKERRKRSGDVMERVGMSHRAKHYPSQLSGGQQQRTAIARAILPRPKLVLADEPTGNLDSKSGKEVMDLLSELHKEGTTIVMVTHSLHDANYAARVINMFDGEIVNQVEM